VVYKTLSLQMAESLGMERPEYGVMYHEQKDQGSDQFCGAASAQMVLESIGAGRIDQEVLYTSCQACSADDPGRHWDSAPDGLVCTLNQRRPASFPGSFRLWELPSEEAISRKLCWAIERGVAPIVMIAGGSHWIVVVGYEASAVPSSVMIAGGSHWIVVVGYEASAVPSSSTDTSYQIIRFEVCDPQAGFPDQSIPYSVETSSGIAHKRYWVGNVLTDVDSGFWQGKFLAICDPDPPADIPAVPIPFV
jgi:hypothetical protein